MNKNQDPSYTAAVDFLIAGLVIFVVVYILIQVVRAF